MGLQPLTAETVEGLAGLFSQGPPFPILVVCDREGFHAVAALKGPNAGEYQELLDEVFPASREETPGQLTAAERETSANAELLSPRELEVLEQLALGSTNNQIAEVLTISPNTVYAHVRHIRTKLGTSNRTQTALVARTMLH